MISETIITRNGLRAWVLASRPKTLSGALLPVVVALAMAWCDSISSQFIYAREALYPECSGVIPAVLCLLFAIIMQILANFVNDYFDFLTGVDDENRLGPRRACAQGWITVRAMRFAIVTTTIIACAVGVPLIAYGGWTMVAVGAACLLLCFLYTLGGARHALGDVFVLLGFGVIPVCTTYWIQLNKISSYVWLMGIACGMVVDTLLVVNNYRDYPTDLHNGKRTLIVRIGKRNAERLYLVLPFAAWLITLYPLIVRHCVCTAILPVGYLMCHFYTYRRMKRIGGGKALNRVLGENSRNMLLYGCTTCLGLLLDAYVC